MRDSQLLQIQRHLSKGGTLTKLEAIRKLGCGNLGGRVHDLRKLRWPVKTEMVTGRSGKRYAVYSFDRKRK